MLIVITDDAFIWDYNNEVLEEYADDIVVVCMSGKAVTEKYKCIVIDNSFIRGRGLLDDSKYHAVEAQKDELIKICEGHKDILFLTDSSAPTFFPYQVLKRVTGLGNLHLWCRSPFGFEGKRRMSIFTEQLSALDEVKSLLFVNSEEMIRKGLRKKNLKDTMDLFKEYYAELFPNVINSINYQEEKKRYWFDFGKMQYIEVFDITEKIAECAFAEEERSDDQILLGIIPETLSLFDKSSIEYLPPRKNGKEICKMLRTMRKALAEVNDIEFNDNDCHFDSNCAGTCAKCDEEIKWLQDQLLKIPEKKRRYPYFMVPNLSDTVVTDRDIELHGDISEVQYE